jgi:methylenetetrahydrofolate reductase (NADPH)
MKVSEAYGPGRFGLSFELFPPKTPAGEEELFRHLPDLFAFKPAYLTCTYGAGGSTRDKTLEIVERVAREYGCAVASHLTCVGSTVAELRNYLAEAERRGVSNIVALRGDPPRGQAAFQAVDGGLRWASELVTLIKTSFPQFGIAVAGYPEKHLEAVSLEADLQNLKRKVDAGGDVVITQLFYDNADFFRFRQRAQELGIRVPLVPGILPVTSLAQIRRITSLCGAKLPETLANDLAACGDAAEAQFRVGIDYAIKQTQELVDAGVPGLHFYVLNKSPATCQVLEALRRPR